MPHPDQTWLTSNSTSSPLCSLKQTPTAETTALFPVPEHVCLSFPSLGPSPRLLPHALTELDIHRTCQDRPLLGHSALAPSLLTQRTCCHVSSAVSCVAALTVWARVCQRITLHKHDFKPDNPTPTPWKDSPSQPQDFSVGSWGMHWDHWRQKLGYSAWTFLFPNAFSPWTPSPGEEPQLVLR